MKKLFFSIVTSIVMLTSLTIMANDVLSITDRSKISEILESIPNKDKTMTYKNLADRLPNLGLSVSYIIVGKLQNDEIKISEGRYKSGDVLYMFSTNEPNDIVKSICPISNSFSFIKRGKAWLPEDRTANFLMTSYKCAAP